MIVARDILLEALDRVMYAVNPKHPVDVLRNVCFRGNTVCAYSQTIGIITGTPFELDLCVQADRLYRIVKASGPEITLSMSGNSLKIKSANSTTSLLTTHVSRHPDFLPRGFRTICSPTNFATAVKAASSFVVSNKASHLLGWVGIKGQYVYASDQNRAVRATIDDASKESCAISDRFCSVVSRYGNPAKVMLCHSMAAAGYDETRTVIVSTLSANKFPFNALDSLFAKRVVHAESFPEGFAEAVSRVNAFVSSVTETREVMLEANGVTLKISMQIPEIGESVEELPWRVDARFTVKLDIRYLADIVRRADVIVIDGLDKNPSCVRFQTAGGSTSQIDYGIAVRV